MKDDDADSDPLSEDSIVNALAVAQSRVAKVERQRAELDRIIAATREEERLLQRLLDVRRGGGSIEQTKFQRSSEADDSSSASPASVRGGKHAAVQAVIDELATASRPLHISELMRLLHERNVEIPGAGTQANVIARLTRDPRLVRTSRGMYGLSVWGLASIEPVTRPRRRRKRVRVTAAK